ncbi:MAG TPA: peptidylprolyl isomerase [Thermoleophilia bacterium]|nr:peptidylprolyl isomerase [Thermoleophilia bacterium]
MKRVIVAAMVLLAFAASAVVLAGCGEKSVPTGSIAVVGDVSITQEQFDDVLAQAKASYEAQGVDFPAADTPEYDKLKGSIVDYLVQTELIKQKAVEMGVTVTTEEIDERVAAIVDQVGGQKKYVALLKKQGVTEEDLRAQLEVQMLQDKVRTEVGADVQVTDEQVKAFFDDPDNKAQFDVPDSVDARHILVKTKAKALAVQRLLKADSSDANWKKVAKEYSIDPGSKGSGGDLGTFPKGRMVKEFEDEAFTIKVGTISDPVKTQFGYHVIEVTKKTPGSTTTFEEAKTGIEERLKLEGQTAAWEKWLQDAETAAAIVYAPGFDPTELMATPSPAATPASSPSPSESATK